MNLREQTEKFLTDAASTVRQNTLDQYRSILTARVLPYLGEEDLSGIDSATAKSLKDRLTEEGLSPTTIGLAVGLLVQVVGSATDARGNRLYNPGWNWNFIKLPKKRNQKAPIAPTEAVSQALQTAKGEVKALIGLLAGSGLRINEARATGVGPGWKGNVWDPATGTIAVHATMVKNQIQPAPKTEAGNRVVDLPPQVNEMLKTELGTNPGPLFRMPLHTLYKRIHALGLPAFHSLRRRRITDLQLASAPESLIKFWAGHAAEGVTERYTKVGSEIAVRKNWAERVA